ncbi:MAG TPA: MBL fold metallo-hydrolase [Thermoanaerobaculia bacterium]|nr:MBL fold metallo-hydrolase [Thermoanaerobaculia bacterium]
MTAARQLSLFEPPPALAAESIGDGAANMASLTRFVVLGSGSSGNSLVVESRGRRVLIDAGFACRELERRLRAVGVEPRSIEAIVLTHEHADHCRGAPRFAARYRIPVYGTRGTLGGPWLRQLCGATPLRPEARLEVAGLRLETFPVSHDARQPVGVVVEDDAGRRLGLLADLGEATASVWARLRDLSALVIESNHDLAMLRQGPYPWSLKQRVAGTQGHLSNVEAAASVRVLLADGLHTVVLYHLSRINNVPALAFEAVAAAVERAGSTSRVELSGQFEPTPWMAV